MFNKKQDIDVKKQDIDVKKQDIGKRLSQHQQKQFDKIAATFRSNAFGRNDVMAVLEITHSPASALLKILLESGKIEAVSGYGKGKYIVKIN